MIVVEFIRQCVGGFNWVFHRSEDSFVHKRLWKKKIRVWRMMNSVTMTATRKKRTKEEDVSVKICDEKK